MNKHYCKKCDEDVDLEIKTTTLTGELKGEEITYEGQVSYGLDCHHEILDEEIININEKVLNDTYRKHNNILSLAEIKNLPNIYGIGKRPLSLILGWGELTFTRYFDGDIPTNTYANILLEINSSPTTYLEILESRKHLISKSTYNKSKTKTLQILEKRSTSSSIFSYLLHECDDITEKSIFKLAYYIDAFHSAFFGENIITEELTLVYGSPIYKNVTIDTLRLIEKPSLTISEKLIADNVIKHFGCYSGKVLSSFIASEPPIIKSSIQKSNSLDKLEIKSYFESVIHKYNMLSPLDIHVFAEEKFKLK